MSLIVDRGFCVEATQSPFFSIDRWQVPDLAITSWSITQEGPWLMLAEFCMASIDFMERHKIYKLLSWIPQSSEAVFMFHLI